MVYINSSRVRLLLLFCMEFPVPTAYLKVCPFPWSNSMNTSELTLVSFGSAVTNSITVQSSLFS